MDSLTQALLGAGVQGAILGRFQGRRALFYGALLGTLPDLDVVIRAADPVTAMTSHRGFSHSLLVLTGLAVAITWGVRRRYPQAEYGPQRLFWAVWLALITHTLLDAFTSYGTQLFWPWLPTPTAWSSIFIIDPVFTVPLLVAVWVAARRGAITQRALVGLRLALAWCALYLGLTLAAQHQAQTRVRAALAAQGVVVDALFSTPMPFNTLLWRVIAKTGEHYVEAVSGVFDQRAPEMVTLSLGSQWAEVLAQSSAQFPAQFPEYARLAWFTGGWLRVDAIDDALVVTDLRMGVAGLYTFRFVMARRDTSTDETTPEQGWRRVTPERWPSRSGGWQEFQRMVQRIVAPEQPLPLAEWSRAALH